MSEYCKVSQLKLNTVYKTSMIFHKLPYYNFDYNQKKRQPIGSLFHDDKLYNNYHLCDLIVMSQITSLMSLYSLYL